MSDCMMDEALLRDELKSVSTTGGAQFVMIHGMVQMLHAVVCSQLGLPSEGKLVSDNYV